MDLSKYVKSAYAIAKEHGWHDNPHSVEHYLMLVITEVSEAVQADRKGHYANIPKRKDRTLFDESTFHKGNSAFMRIYEDSISGTVEDELADVCIRCLDFRGYIGIGMATFPVGLRPDADTFTEHMYFITSQLTGNATTDNLTLSYSLAFTVSYIFRYCEAKEIDILWFIERKMMYNSLRPYRHGGKKY